MQLPTGSPSAFRPRSKWGKWRSEARPSSSCLPACLPAALCTCSGASLKASPPSPATGETRGRGAGGREERIEPRGTHISEAVPVLDLAAVLGDGREPLLVLHEIARALAFLGRFAVSFRPSHGQQKRHQAAAAAARGSHRGTG